MSEPRPPLAAFDEETVVSVAAEFDRSRDDLRDLVARHQRGVRDLPGVEDIVYEWRRQRHVDPLVYRSESAYVLAHRPHVWEEFVSALDLSADEADALRAIHDRQARVLVDDDAVTRLDADEAMVLTRP